eukprot:1195878-Pyramimonas_sp.AAC.1
MPLTSKAGRYNSQHSANGSQDTASTNKIRSAASGPPPDPLRTPSEPPLDPFRTPSGPPPDPLRTPSAAAPSGSEQF